MIQVLTATRHHHGRAAIERWFGDRVQFIALSPSQREPMHRDYINRVVSEIHEGVAKLASTSRVVLLVTGHPFFNMVAGKAIRDRLGETPFLVLVWDGKGNYEAFSSDYVLNYMVVGDHGEKAP